MKITISAQHLYGNDPDGFQSDAWLRLLEQEYRDIAVRYFPDADISVVIDRQRASGCCRPVSIDFSGADDTSFEDQNALEFIVGQTANTLFDKRGHEFFA